MFLRQIVNVVFFLIYQTINLSKVGQPYQFYCFWGHFDIVTVIYCGMFCGSYSTLQIILSSQIVYLYLKSQCPRNPDQHLFHVFCTGVFCAPILRIFLDIIVISRYCPKFLSSNICTYWMKGAFVNIIFASGIGIAAPDARTFLDSNNFFISVSRFSLILYSIFVGKLILSRSVKYCKGIL